jgi:23S rRNA pseudouridine955/2504/2580 synthase
MSTAPLFLTVDPIYHHQRLDNFLFTRLKGVPKTCVYRFIRQGKIRVNKKRCKPSYSIQGKDIIRLPPLSISDTNSTAQIPSKTLTQELSNAILFENEYFMIINKPYGLAVHGGSGVRLGLIESLRHIYSTAPYLELVHRLDRDTSGCLLIAKKPFILKQLHTLFRNKKIQKTYLMLSKGHWPKHLSCVNQALKKNQLASGERIVKINPEGQPSITRFILRQHFNQASLVEAIPQSGRTHQIRVHAQSVGMPIGGDEKYGDKLFNQSMRQNELKRLFLHASALKFVCPHTQSTIHVMAPLPPALEAVLTRLRHTEGGT